MSTSRTTAGGWIYRTAERGPNGRGICRWCHAEVPKRRRTFCSEECVHEWKLRTDPGYLRRQVLMRDHGICAHCGLNTIEFFRRFQRLPAPKRKELRRRLDLHASRKSFWDADHIVPVAEGGGECDLSNLRTLCLWCHLEETAHLRKRLKMGEEKESGVRSQETGDSGSIASPCSRRSLRFKKSRSVSS